MRRAENNEERRSALLDCARRFPFMCIQARALTLGASEARVRRIRRGVQTETETGELYTEAHGLLDTVPGNKTETWIIDEIKQVLETYSWCEPDAVNTQGETIRRPTSEDTEGLRGLWRSVETDPRWALLAKVRVRAAPLRGRATLSPRRVAHTATAQA